MGVLVFHASSIGTGTASKMAGFALLLSALLLAKSYHVSAQNIADQRYPENASFSQSCSKLEVGNYDFAPQIDSAELGAFVSPPMQVVSYSQLQRALDANANRPPLGSILDYTKYELRVGESLSLIALMSTDYPCSRAGWEVFVFSLAQDSKIEFATFSRRESLSSSVVPVFLIENCELKAIGFPVLHPGQLELAGPMAVWQLAHDFHDLESHP